MCILEWWKIICQGLKLIFLHFFFNFSCKRLGLNIFVLVNFFLSKWFTVMSNPYLIQNFFPNGMYIIFQGIQLFLKFLLHAFHFLFQPRQLEFHNFTFLENPNLKTVQLVEIPLMELWYFRNPTWGILGFPLFKSAGFVEFWYAKRKWWQFCHNVLIFGLFKRSNLYGLPHVSLFFLGLEINTKETSVCNLTSTTRFT